MLVATSLPLVLWRELLGGHGEPGWQPAATLAVALAFFAGTFTVPLLRPLRLFALVLSLMALGRLLTAFLGRSAGYRDWAAGAPAALSFAVANDLKLLPVAIVAAGLFLAGMSRGQLFLRVGDLRARAGLPFTERRVPWPRLAFLIMVVAYGYVFVHVTVTRGAHPGALATILAWAPVILAGSAINAFSEEFLFRNSLLSPLVPVLGRHGALWLTSLRFGIGHFYGNPSGPLGVAGAGLLGFLLGKSMFDTRGSGWAWIIHFVGDVLIFALIATTAPALWTP